MNTYNVKSSIGNQTFNTKIKARTKTEACFYAETQGLGLIRSVKLAESRLWLLIYPAVFFIFLFAFYQVA